MNKWGYSVALRWREIKRKQAEMDPRKGNSWVPSSARDVDKGWKRSSNNTAESRNERERRPHFYIPTKSTNILETGTGHVLFHWILATPLRRQVLFTHCAMRKWAQKAKCLPKVMQMVALVFKLTVAAPRSLMAPRCCHQQESPKSLNLQRRLILADPRSSSGKLDKARAAVSEDISASRFEDLGVLWPQTFRASEMT